MVLLLGRPQIETARKRPAEDDSSWRTQKEEKGAIKVCQKNGEPRSKSLTGGRRRKVNSFKRPEESIEEEASNVKTLGTRLGPTKSCVIDVSTGQIDESNAGSVRDQWDRVAWQQKTRIHIAKIVGNQTQNK